MLRIVAATRLTEDRLYEEASLSRSIERLAFAGGVVPEILFENSDPLPVVYNAALARAEDDDTLLFTHDDVRFDDWFLAQRLKEALAVYDVVGVAGNGTRMPKQYMWGGWYRGSVLETGERSGAVAHGGRFDGRVTDFGPTPGPAKLLDGVFLAAEAGTLRRAGVAFDPQFAFHFYDLDFCRACEKAGLSMGTWPIAITHSSEGDYGSPEWKMAYYRYLAKWKE